MGVSPRIGSASKRTLEGVFCDEVRTLWASVEHTSEQAWPRARTLRRRPSQAVQTARYSCPSRRLAANGLSQFEATKALLASVEKRLSSGSDDDRLRARVELVRSTMTDPIDELIAGLRRSAESGEVPLWLPEG